MIRRVLLAALTFMNENVETSVIAVSLGVTDDQRL